MKTYKVTFEDTFSFALSTRIGQLTDSQYAKALEQKKNKVIVVNKLVNHIHITLIIKKIELLTR